MALTNLEEAKRRDLTCSVQARGHGQQVVLISLEKPKLRMASCFDVFWAGKTRLPKSEITKIEFRDR